MNNKFSEYVSSSAFTLTLSKPMISALKWVKFGQKNKCASGFFICDPPNFMSIAAINSRGLIENPEFGKGWKTTKAGDLVFSLLVEADFIEINEDKINEKA